MLFTIKIDVPNNISNRHKIADASKNLAEALDFFGDQDFSVTAEDDKQGIITSYQGYAAEMEPELRCDKCNSPNELCTC